MNNRDITTSDGRLLHRHLLRGEETITRQMIVLDSPMSIQEKINGIGKDQITAGPNGQGHAKAKAMDMR